MHLDKNSLSEVMGKAISKPEALAALVQATNMAEPQLLAQMPALKGDGSVRITTEDDKVRVIVNDGRDEYYVTLGDAVSITTRVDEPEGFDGH